MGCHCHDICNLHRDAPPHIRLPHPQVRPDIRLRHLRLIMCSEVSRSITLDHLFRLDVSELLVPCWDLMRRQVLQLSICLHPMKLVDHLVCWLQLLREGVMRIATPHLFPSSFTLNRGHLLHLLSFSIWSMIQLWLQVSSHHGIRLKVQLPDLWHINVIGTSQDWPYYWLHKVLVVSWSRCPWRREGKSAQCSPSSPLELSCIGLQPAGLQPPYKDCFALDQRRHAGPLNRWLPPSLGGQLTFTWAHHIDGRYCNHNTTTKRNELRFTHTSDFTALSLTATPANPSTSQAVLWLATPLSPGTSPGTRYDQHYPVIRDYPWLTGLPSRCTSQHIC